MPIGETTLTPRDRTECLAFDLRAAIDRHAATGDARAIVTRDLLGALSPDDVAFLLKIPFGSFLKGRIVEHLSTNHPALAWRVKLVLDDGIVDDVFFARYWETGADRAISSYDAPWQRKLYAASRLATLAVRLGIEIPPPRRSEHRRATRRQ